MCVSRYSWHIISPVVHKQCPVKVTEVFHPFLVRIGAKQSVSIKFVKLSTSRSKYIYPWPI